MSHCDVAFWCVVLFKDFKREESLFEFKQVYYTNYANYANTEKNIKWFVDSHHIYSALINLYIE